MLLAVTAAVEVFGFSFATALPELATTRLQIGADGLGMLHAARAVGGMIAGSELVEDKASRKSYDPGRKVGETCRDLCTDNGGVVRAGRDVIVLSPPLIISRDEIDILGDTIAQTLDETVKTLSL